jgi:acrylyl-CoA reductase (NADPH)
MQALILEQQDGKTLASVQAVEESRLPEGEVTVDIDWSSLNYKDALAITGKGKIIRNFPMVPGIDFAGRVHTSEIRASMRASRCCSPAGAWVKITGAGWQRRRA